MITFIHPATGIRVLPDKEWFQKDFASEGRDLDLDQSFFEQMRSLQLAVPLLADKNVKKPENSVTKFSLGDVNSYFMMFCRSKNSFYSHWVLDEEDSSEAWNGSSINKCYNVSDSFRLYDCKFVRTSFDCMRSAFLFDCRNCENCFGATNKRNRKYLWWNEQLTKEEWERRMCEVDLSCRSQQTVYKDQFRHMMETQAIWPENFNEQAEGCTGEYLTRCTRLHSCFGCLEGVEDCFWVNYGSENARDSAFCSGLFTSQECFYSTNPARCSQMRYTYNCQMSQNLEYSMQCIECEDCFGCVGLYRKKFHIFNKLFAEEAYWQKLDEIKTALLNRGEYGEFFPLSMSPGYFPDSGAPIYFAAPPEIGWEKLGALKFEPEDEGAMGPELSSVTNLKRLDEIPDCVDALNETTWTNAPIYDEVMHRRFAMIRPEIQFYKNNRLAPPARHFVGRINDLLRESNTGKFETTACTRCAKEITVGANQTYPGRKIFCRSCYLAFLEKNG